MAVADQIAVGGTAALAGGPPVCGHDTNQRIGALDGGGLWCGDCWSAYAGLVERYRTGHIDRERLFAGLMRLLDGYADEQRPASLDEAQAIAAAAVLDIDTTIAEEARAAAEADAAPRPTPAPWSAADPDNAGGSQ